MHVASLTIENIRSIDRLELRLDSDQLAGWHVIVGDNGAGKTTFLRALAIALVGEANAHASRQDWNRWLAAGHNSASIGVELIPHPTDAWTGNGRQGNGCHEHGRQGQDTVRFGTDIVEGPGNGSSGRCVSIKFTNRRHADKTIWGGGAGWFSASFGAFRGFADSDPAIDRLYTSHPRLAAHMSLFGDNVFLGKSLRWLQALKRDELDERPIASETLNAVVSFINHADLLPHGTRIAEVMWNRVVVVDDRGYAIDAEDMSEGCQSILSVVLELLRLLFATVGSRTALDCIDLDDNVVRLPGVVAIDAIDAHLHPDWQKRIGDWFVQRFPDTQFFVTTHSSLICRGASNGSVWMLSSPGSNTSPRRLAGGDLDRLVYGNLK